MRRYAQLTVDSANIKAAVRSAAMGKNRDFIERAIAPAGTLDTQKLIDAAVGGADAAVDPEAAAAVDGASKEVAA